ncbi:MAG: septum formation family protein [Actinobacteria bacterium]|nr:septum formation family protein [Actinomycetota bacterium]
MAAITGLIAAGCSQSSGTIRTTTSRPQSSTTAPSTAMPTGATATGLRDLRTGQCFVVAKDDPAAADRAVWVLPCSDPHTHEVTDEVTYAGPTVKGGAYPGAPVVQDWAEQTCFDRFESFVGRPWTTSSFEIETWWPSEESWGRNDRKVLCTVFPADGGRTTGTARGADR